MKLSLKAIETRRGQRFTINWKVAAVDAKMLLCEKSISEKIKEIEIIVCMGYTLKTLAIL